jgi:acetyl-CoA C-acetyltransferase
MNATAYDPERIPVVVASGQSIERTELVTPVDLMVRAAEEALAAAPALRDRIDRLSVVDILSRSGPAPATELGERIGARPNACEVTTIGGNSPQWLVNRAAGAIAEGALSVTLIAGAEAIRSSRARRAAGMPPEVGRTQLPPDPAVGDDLPGIGPAEAAIGLLLPVHVYPLFESVVAARAGHDAAGHRRVMGELLAPFTEVAAANPYAWFHQARTATAIATPSADNRLVCDPYTKWMCAYLGSDQGAALLVCSLAEARRAGVADRAVFVWSGADITDVRFPTARPDPGRSPAIAAAGRAALAAATSAAGRGGGVGIGGGGIGGGGAGGVGIGAGGVGIDDIEVLDIYSCFPSAVELAAAALGIALDDSRVLTVTGGLPYFGGPGNNYTTHSIATVTDILRDPASAPRRGGGGGGGGGSGRGGRGGRGGGSGGGGRGGGSSGVRLGLTTGLGWFVTKHSIGVYGTAPPPAGFHQGDTTTAQSQIDATAVEVALEVAEPTPATVIAATVIRDDQGAPTGAPLLARLPDGRHMALAPADDEVTATLGHMDIPGLVGSPIVVEPGEARYRLATG